MGEFRCSTPLQALIILSVLAVLEADEVEGRHRWPDCPPFSCGPLGKVSFPFRQASDPPGCGYKSYELVCSDTEATIRIDNATYYVSGINYSDSSFWVVDANLDLYNSCPLPRWNRRPYDPSYRRQGMEVELAPVEYSFGKSNWPLLSILIDSMAYFVKCSQEVKDNGNYVHVACLSTNYSFAYMLTAYTYGYMEYLEPSCGYLAMTPLSPLPSCGYLAMTTLIPLPWTWRNNASYVDVVKSMRRGFAVRFPFGRSIKECLMREIRAYHEQPDITTRILEILLFVGFVMNCAFGEDGKPPYAGYGGSFIEGIMTWIPVCRFVLAPLVILIFLAHKYWKTRITIDAVEKFLRMQEMLGPTRYAYTDITAITSHFREKLGQGGYGSVFKGVLLPGNVHVAVKMLEGNSKCNGEDFISEVSTIGRIHHVNVVRLVGFCSEEMRRALVYEYMPRGSLDKYIFSSEKEKAFSWHKLNEIALGIARGINYLHQGCDMQILHFDIKPHNILLDNNFVPKVADFGLAKLYPRGNSFVPLSALRGTVGYIAPEMISRSFGVISSKSDVYSFGMLLLEMAGGRRNADPNAGNSSQAYYPSWVYDRLTEQEVGVIFAPVSDMHELETKLCIAGLWCIQMKSHDRPTMSEVIEMLEGDVDGLQMPSRPFFCDEGHIHIEDSYHLASELTAIFEEDE